MCVLFFEIAMLQAYCIVFKDGEHLVLELKTK